MLRRLEQRFAPVASGGSDHVVGASGSIYRFDEFEIDSAQACLKKAGQDQYIRQQAFQVLLYLIERPHALITKEELVSQFWRDTAVTDNAVVQCVADIRKALGDDSRHPRFIKTVPKVGYRFIGDVYVEPVKASAAPSEPATAQIPPSLAGRYAPVIRRLHPAPVVGVIAALVVISYLLLHRPVDAHMEILLPATSEKKPVAVMYFENQSHKADLNWLREGLADMFIADLAHSDKLSVLSRQQLELLLERAGH
ncbi:MAG: winged helix-turn-helix domain-containing protein, partial [Acidobacteriia bacterium]|nr:winged helix-turn-helix domain-containing protein [Terriglobia bacterium]